MPAEVMGPLQNRHVSVGGTVAVHARDDDPAAVRRLSIAMLRSLHALLTVHSVTVAASRLGLGQPAMSRQLAQLRELTGDQLLVRSGSRMILTARGEALLPVVERVLADLASICDRGGELVPARVSRAFKLATYDFLPTSFFADFVCELTTESPQSTVEIQTLGDRADLVRRLCEGDIDVAITSRTDIPGDLRSMRLFEEPLVCVVGMGHPLLRKPTTAVYHSCEHLSSLGQAPGVTDAIDELIARSGTELRVTVRTQYLSLVPAILAKTNLVFTTGQALAAAMAANHGLQALRAPISAAKVSCHLVWHERTHHDRAAAWMRDKIVAIAKGLHVDG